MRSSTLVCLQIRYGLAKRESVGEEHLEPHRPIPVAQRTRLSSGKDSWAYMESIEYVVEMEVVDLNENRCDWGWDGDTTIE